MERYENENEMMNAPVYQIMRVKPKRIDSCLWQVTYRVSLDAEQINQDSEALTLVLLDMVAYQYGIQKGKHLTADQFDDMVVENDLALCYYEGMKIVHRGMYCTQDVEIKLKQRQFSKVAINQALQKLRENHYLNDESFVQVFIENRMERESRRRIEERLRAKGVSNELIKAGFDAVTPDHEDMMALEISKALQMLNKKSPPILSTLDREAQYKMRQKYLGSLMRKGFSFEASKTAFQMWLDASTQTD